MVALDNCEVLHRLVGREHVVVDEHEGGVVMSVMSNWRFVRGTVSLFT